MDDVAPSTATVDPLTSTLRPLDDAVLTVRIIKSFEYRTTKNLILPHVDLTTMTVGALKDFLRKEIQTASGFKPFRTAVLDTIKLYTKAHGSKTTNLIINFENEDWILQDDAATLASVGIENESEVSFFNRELYEAFKINPTQKWYAPNTNNVSSTDETTLRSFQLSRSPSPTTSAPRVSPSAVLFRVRSKDTSVPVRPVSLHSTVHTFPYKHLPTGVSISLDVYLPDETKFGLVASLTAQILRQARGAPSLAVESPHTLPVLVYWHGGGLVCGNRGINDWFPKWLLKDALNAGFAVVVPDYTLLSPSSAETIIEDVKDCFDYIANDLNGELGNHTSQSIDPTRIAVAGSSAGGCLSYYSAMYATPRPQVVAPIYAMGGNYLLDHYFTPKTSDFFMGMSLLKDPTPFLALLESKDTVHSTSINGSKDARVSYYVYLLQSGLFNSVLTGIPTLSQELAPLSEKEREKALPVEKRRLFPHLNVHKDLPPMFLLHGTKDSAVPIEESRNMKTLLEAVGVHVELVEVEGADHGFDTVKDSSEIAGLEKLVPFLLKYL